MPRTTVLRIRTGLFCLACGAATLSVLGAPTPVPARVPAPRPLSEPEREAVRLAVSYLDSGAESWWAALSHRSPFRALGHDAALREIEVRNGPAAGARWELKSQGSSVPPGVALFSIDYPSGLDQILVLRFVSEPEGWKLQSVRSLAEPSAWNSVIKKDPAKEKTKESPKLFVLDSPKTYGAAGIGVAFLVLFAGLYGVRSRWISLPLTLAGSLLGAASTLLVLDGISSPSLPGLLPPGSSARTDEFPRLAPLLSFRRELEAREDFAKKSALPRLTPGSEAADVARLWNAQRILQTNALEPARKILATFPSPSNNPWVETLRGRLAFLQKREAEAALAYENAASKGPQHDGILFEAAQVFMLLGFEAPARAYRERLARLDSRAAEVHYLIADAFAGEHLIPEAETEFLRGWSLKPLAHRELFDWGGDWDLLRRPAIGSLLRLDSVFEPAVTPVDRSLHPLTLPSSATAHLCGRLFRVKIGDSEIAVPGGAELAPSSLPVEDAGAQDRAEESEALSQSARFVLTPPTMGVLSQPLLRHEIQRICRTLAENQRWSDLISITSGFTGSDERVPSELLLLRSRALQRSNKTEEARKLLTDLGNNASFLKRSNPALLYQLGEILVTVEEFDLAMKLMQRGAARLKVDFVVERIGQVRAEKRLSTSYSKSETAHFQLRFPPERAASFAVNAARVLEAERTRLLKWIPAVSETPVNVQLLWYDEFRRTFSGGADILGLFDGTIRVPLAGVADFPPFVVGIMTHELAHALVADVTEGRAPHWFQEGLAQHLEMRKFRPNYITEYSAQHTLLSLPVVEYVLRSFADSTLVEQAYQESEWVVGYIESRYGMAGIHRLLKAFREGRQTSEALQAALQISIPELDQQFVAWSLKQPKMQRDTIIPYDVHPDENFRLSHPDPSGVKKNLEVPDSLQN